MAEVLIIDGATVRRLLTMPRCIDAVEAAAIAVSNDTIKVPLRRAMALAGESGPQAETLLMMPGSAATPPVFGAKLVSLHPDNPQNGLPAIQGFVSLFDNTTGSPVAIIDGASLTAIRTAAASGSATRMLARKDVKTHGIFGAGVQARTHAAAIVAARPSISETLIWARDSGKAEQAAADMRETLGIRVYACRDIAQVAGCDVVTTVTGATKPLFAGACLMDGAHLNVVGAHTPEAREVDTDTILRSSVFVEKVAHAMEEAGELVIPVAEGVFTREDIAAEIGDVARGKHKGRSDDKQITLYKSLGNIAQDLHAAWTVYRAAQKSGAGTLVML